MEERFFFLDRLLILRENGNILLVWTFKINVKMAFLSFIAYFFSCLLKFVGKSVCLEISLSELATLRQVFTEKINKFIFEKYILLAIII